MAARATLRSGQLPRGSIGSTRTRPGARSSCSARGAAAGRLAAAAPARAAAAAAAPRWPLRGGAWRSTTAQHRRDDPGRRPALVIGAHYDTLATPEGFVGANNGAAGTAIAVELARDVAKLRRPPGAPELRFVLFDGEEPPRALPEETRDFYSSGLRGSRAYVARHGATTRAMVLVDYVANRGLHLPREASSSLALSSEIRAAARRTGHAAVFPDDTQQAIIDDHTPFLRAGIPAVDLIDWTYPGHSTQDTLDKLSVRSVDAVGETLVELVRRLDEGRRSFR